MDISGQIGVRTTLTNRVSVPPIFTGRIKTLVQAQVAPFIATFSGRIGIQTSIRTNLFLPPTLFLAGRISVTSTGNVDGGGVYFDRYFQGRIKTTVSARTFPVLPIPLSGVLISIQTTLQGFAGPYWVIPNPPLDIEGLPPPDLPNHPGPPGSRLSIQVSARLLTSELLEPLPPYPPAFLTWPIEHYLNLITSEHINKPKYIRTVATSLAPVVENQHLIAAIPGLFDLDYSQGQQEDFTGQWVGKSRWLELPNVFFTWDWEGLGWNQGNWKDLVHDSANKLERLDDYHYRLLLYASVIANQWDGSIPGAYEAWDTLFHYTGLKVVIQDYGNMTMMYGMLWSSEPDIVLISLFTTGQMDLKPEGIELISYVFSPIPNVGFFAFDAETESVSGWDSGYWGVLVPPGQTFIPG